ncbi:MAG: MFS transporter [Proteobacteria bacterium]|nr:MFS transporter [Pseudomonadota bacterium]
MTSDQRGRIRQTLAPEGKVYYGWWIVLASGGLQMLGSLLWMQSFGAYMVLLQRDFGWSKTLVSGAFSLTRIESGILGPLQGWLVDRFGPRLILRIGIVLFGLGFFWLSRIETIIGFYGAIILIALGSSLGGFATLMVSLVNWFNRHRAKAIALSQLGYSLGGLLVPVVIVALNVYGWRDTAFVSGLIVMFVGLPLVQLVSHRPEDRGEVIDGSVQNEQQAAAEVARLKTDFTARQAMRTRAFWLISIGHAIALLTVSAVMVHLVPHLIESLDYSMGKASIFVAIMTATQMAGQMMGGYLGDRLNKRYICVACMVGHFIGLMLLAYAVNELMVVAFAVIHGFAWGARGPLMVALRADYFGSTSFGTIMGFSSLIVMLGMSGGPLFAGMAADYFGAYQPGLAILATTALLGCFCFLAASPPVLRD